MKDIYPQNQAAEHFKPLDPSKYLEKLATTRGFPFVAFRDSYRNRCTVEQSSFAECPFPGRSALWIGKTGERMHLTFPQVHALVAVLQSWLETGELSLEERSERPARRALQLRPEEIEGDDLDEDDELWCLNEQIKDMLTGGASNEDHEAVIRFLKKAGLPDGTAKRVHRAIVCGDLKQLPPEPTE